MKCIDSYCGHDVQADKPVRHCTKCRGEIYAGEYIYQWYNDGCDLCEDCFREIVEGLPTDILAWCMGVEHEQAV